jgi:hypothetical protein
LIKAKEHDMESILCVHTYTHTNYLNQSIIPRLLHDLHSFIKAFLSWLTTWMSNKNISLLSFILFFMELKVEMKIVIHVDGVRHFCLLNDKKMSFSINRKFFWCACGKNEFLKSGKNITVDSWWKKFWIKNIKIEKLWKL